MSATNAQYAASEAALRRCMAYGTSPSPAEMVVLLKVVQDAASRGTTGNTAQEAVRASLATAITNLTLLDATACAASLGVTAAATVVTEVARITTAKASILTGELSVPSLVTSTSNLADGLPGPT